MQHIQNQVSNTYQFNNFLGSEHNTAKYTDLIRYRAPVRKVDSCANNCAAKFLIIKILSF
jgi:hypothetical protein